MSYNLTFMENSTSFLTTMQGVNTMTGDLLGALILFALGLVMFIALKRHSTEVAVLATSFALSVVGLFLFTMEFISVQIFVIPLILLIGSVFYTIVSRG